MVTYPAERVAHLWHVLQDTTETRTDDVNVKMNKNNEPDTARSLSSTQFMWLTMLRAEEGSALHTESYSLGK